VNQEERGRESDIASMLEDGWNITQADLRAWAYRPDAMCPIEDWDLAVTTDANSELLLEFAADSACPSRNFFLRCLYLLVGDAVRSAFRAHRRDVVERLISQVGDQSPSIIQWAERARTLLDAPPTAVDYALWCEGGYVPQGDVSG
jgi:hypothetical protein